MNGTRAMATELVGAVAAGAGDACALGICPPFPYLDVVRQYAGHIALGAQNVSHEADGAYTGEVSAGMLVDCGCHYAIVGHSERRALYSEDDTLVAAKFACAQAAGLVPILCVGETREEREAGDTEAVVGRQLAAVMNHAGASAFEAAVLAYEPVWAIGTGLTASPDEAQAVHAFLRAQVAAHDAGVAAGLQILYGGSVKGDNAPELFARGDIDGGLIGGASLKADDFLQIGRAGAASAAA